MEWDDSQIPEQCHVLWLSYSKYMKHLCAYARRHVNAQVLYHKIQLWSVTSVELCSMMSPITSWPLPMTHNDFQALRGEPSLPQQG